MRVAYDAQALMAGDGGTGKGVQLRNLVVSEWAEFQGYAPTSRNHQVNQKIVQGGSRHYLLWQQAGLPRLLRSAKPDVFLAPYNTAPLWLPSSTRLVLVLHDLILMQSFKARTARKRVENFYRRHLIRPSVARASQVLTVSDFSRKAILRTFPAARVTVIPCTIAESWFAGAAALSRQQRGNYILLVTAAPPHKNTARALRAYARYVTMAGAKAAELRIVGLAHAAVPFREIVRSLGLEARVVFEPFVTTATLQQLYAQADAVLVPSLMEGFGIPVLEGMASGTPVLASQNSSMSEVGGDAAQYFDPMDETSIADAMFAVTNDADLWSQAATQGIAQAAKFHPEIVRRQIDQFWCQIANETHTCPN
jgi:glycosyltransferase involved in cell wall biosynthesis